MFMRYKLISQQSSSERESGVYMDSQPIYKNKEQDVSAGLPECFCVVPVFSSLESLKLPTVLFTSVSFNGWWNVRDSLLNAEQLYITTHKSQSALHEVSRVQQYILYTFM